MRAKYISKTARRRTIRPDGDHYRVMRRHRGAGRLRARILVQSIAAAALIGVVLIVYFALARR